MSFSRGLFGSFSLFDLALTAVFTVAAKSVMHALAPAAPRPIFEPEEQEGYRRGIDLIHRLRHEPRKSAYRLCYDAIDKGADITARAHDGLSLFDVAAKRNLTQILKLLAKKSLNQFHVDPKTAKNLITHALNKARSGEGRITLLKKIPILDRFIADQQRRFFLMDTQEGRDGLRLVDLIKNEPSDASHEDHVEFLSFCGHLIESGADLTIVDENGYNAIEWAARRNFDNVLYLLVMAIEEDKSVDDVTKFAILECASAYPGRNNAVRKFLSDQLKALPQPA